MVIFMFAKGEKIVYGQTGVCEITDICEKALIKNQKMRYYVLKPLYQQNNIIYAPVDNNKIFMRPVMTKTEADALILKIPEIKENLKGGDLTPEECRMALADHTCDALVELTAKIYRKKKTAQSLKKKLGFSDEKYMHLAEGLLFGELASALEIPVDDVERYIGEKINNRY